MIRLNNNTDYHLDYVRMILAYLKATLVSTNDTIESIAIEYDRATVYGVDCVLVEVRMNEVDEFYNMRKVA